MLNIQAVLTISEGWGKAILSLFPLKTKESHFFPHLSEVISKRHYNALPFCNFECHITVVLET